MAIKGLLFDKDGTLIDFDATWMPVLHEAVEALGDGQTSRRDRLLAIAGLDRATGRALPGSLIAAGNSAELAAAWAEEIPGRSAAGLTALLDRIFELGGMRYATALTDLGPLFDRLGSRGFRLGVATNDSLAGARATLAPFGILDRLDFIAGYDSGHGAKPGPGMVEGFAAATGLAAAEIAVIGDNLHDLDMGRSAGAGLVIGVLSGTGSRRELAPSADHLLDDVAGLEAFLPDFA